MLEFFVVFQQIEIDTVQGEVYDGLDLPFRPSNVPIFRLYGVTPVLTIANRTDILTLM